MQTIEPERFQTCTISIDILLKILLCIACKLYAWMQSINVKRKLWRCAGGWKIVRELHFKFRRMNRKQFFVGPMNPSQQSSKTSFSGPQNKKVCPKTTINSEQNRKREKIIETLTFKSNSQPSHSLKIQQ